MEKEQISILVEEEILIEQGNKVLECAKQIEFLLAKINRIGNRMQNGWKGENGALCYEWIYEMIQKTERGRKKTEEYAKAVKELVEK